MSKIIKVKATWEFEFDSEGYDSKFVDIPGLAKESAKSELIYLLNKRDIQASDFKYTVADGTKYGEIIQLPPKEFAHWMCCPDMMDDNFIKPDCDNANCTECCLKYLLSRVDDKPSETEKATLESCDCEKQPVEVANEEVNKTETAVQSTDEVQASEEVRRLGAEVKIEQWARQCSGCSRAGICKLKDRIHEFIYHYYNDAAYISANEIDLDVQCGLYAPKNIKSFIANKLNVQPNYTFHLPCPTCTFKDYCYAQERKQTAQLFVHRLSLHDKNLTVKLKCSNYHELKRRK